MRIRSLDNPYINLHPRGGAIWPAKLPFAGLAIAEVISLVPSASSDEFSRRYVGIIQGTAGVCSLVTVDLRGTPSGHLMVPWPVLGLTSSNGLVSWLAGSVQASRVLACSVATQKKHITGSYLSFTSATQPGAPDMTLDCPSFCAC